MSHKVDFISALSAAFQKNKTTTTKKRVNTFSLISTTI